MRKYYYCGINVVLVKKFISEEKDLDWQIFIFHYAKTNKINKLY